MINEPYKETSLLERIKSIFNFDKSSAHRNEVKLPDQQTIRKEAPKKEVSDLVEIKEDLLEDVKEEIKRELMKKVRAKLRGKMYES